MLNRSTVGLQSRASTLVAVVVAVAVVVVVVVGGGGGGGGGALESGSYEFELDFVLLNDTSTHGVRAIKQLRMIYLIHVYI